MWWKVLLWNRNSCGMKISILKMIDYTMSPNTPHYLFWRARLSKTSKHIETTILQLSTNEYCHINHIFKEFKKIIS